MRESELLVGIRRRLDDIEELATILGEFERSQKTADRAGLALQDCYMALHNLYRHMSEEARALDC